MLLRYHMSIHPILIMLHGCHMSIVASLVPYASKISYEYPPNINYASWMSYEYSGHAGSLCFMEVICV